MVYTLRFFSLKCSLFHNSYVFGSCIIHILYTGCAKIKKKIRRQKVNQLEKWLKRWRIKATENKSTDIAFSLKREPCPQLH